MKNNKELSLEIKYKQTPSNFPNNPNIVKLLS